MKKLRKLNVSKSGVASVADAGDKQNKRQFDKFYLSNIYPKRFRPSDHIQDNDQKISILNKLINKNVSYSGIIDVTPSEFFEKESMLEESSYISHVAGSRWGILNRISEDVWEISGEKTWENHPPEKFAQRFSVDDIEYAKIYPSPMVDLGDGHIELKPFVISKRGFLMIPGRFNLLYDKSGVASVVGVHVARLGYNDLDNTTKLEVDHKKPGDKLSGFLRDGRMVDIEIIGTIKGFYAASETKPKLKITVRGSSVASNPSWVMDEGIWTKARQDALRSRDEDHPMYWGLVTHIYKQAGGRIRPGVGDDLDVLSTGRRPFGPDKGAGAVDSQLAKGTLIEYEHNQTLSDLISAILQDLHDYNMIAAIPKKQWDTFKERLESYKRITIERIAKDHLLEKPDYYDRLAAVENLSPAGFAGVLNKIRDMRKHGIHADGE